MKTISLYTLGCKLNFTETSTITDQFLKNNFLIDKNNNPDIFIINTCSVTQNAERECRQIVRRIIKKYPETFIIVLGCYSQMRPKEIEKIPGVDLILGSKEKFDILKYEFNFKKYCNPKTFVTENKDDDEIIPAESTASNRTRAFLKIQDGCDYHCSYCTVPLARGSSRSLPLRTIIDKIKEIASKGFKEVVLTGVNVSDYGKNVNSHFFELLKAVDEINEIPRVRISSIEPNILNDEVIDFISKSKRICHHFHIPMQSGDNNVLKAMQRRYGAEHFRNLIFRIKEKIPDAGIGLDVIAGFPTETEQMFENTYKLLLEIPFTYLHVFTYSPRPDTKASTIKSIPGSKECDKRSERLRSLGLNKKNNFLNSQVNKIYDILIEERIENGLIFGLTKNYIKVGIPVEKNLINTIVKVKLIEAKNGFCIGEKSGI
jgi:threonylcarbamoyladenosine tRNA methylthiotransferase MtaB